MPLELVPLFEAELFSFYNHSIIFFPLRALLRKKKNVIDRVLTVLIIFYFSVYFVRFVWFFFGKEFIFSGK